MRQQKAAMPRMATVITVYISYNGGMPRTHTVSVGFADRLDKYVATRPYLDVVIRRATA
jgi:hypothetical protein